MSFAVQNINKIKNLFLERLKMVLLMKLYPRSLLIETIVTDFTNILFRKVGNFVQELPQKQIFDKIHRLKIMT